MSWIDIYQCNQMQMQNMFNPMNNMNPMAINNPMDQILFNAYQINNQQMNMPQNLNPSNEIIPPIGNDDFKVNLMFSSMNGPKINMVFDCNETIEGVLTKFLKRVNLPELIGDLKEKLKFILNAEHINFGDKRKLKDVLVSSTTTTNVIVHDTANLIGAKY